MEARCTVRMRVLIVNVPRMLRDMLKALIHQEQDAEIVGERFGTVGSLDQLQEAITEASPDVLVLGCDQRARVGLEERLLSNFPKLRVVALEGEGRTAVVYRQRTEKLKIDEVSPDVLLHAVKGFIYLVG